MLRFLVVISLLLSICAPASSKTLLDISTAARYLCEETDAYYFASSEVTVYVNMAQNAVANMVEEEALIELSQYDTLAVAVGAYKQALPSDYLKIQNVFLNGYVCKKKKVQEIWSISPNNKSGETVSNTNPWYVLHDGGVMIYPLQTAAGTYEVYSLKSPTVLSLDADECDLSDQMENLVILQTAIYMLKKDHEDGKAQRVEAQLDKEASLINQALVGPKK